MERSQTMTKTFIFPVHALAYEKMLEKIEEGCMPNLEKLMDNGSYGVSKSVFSTASAVDYVSLLTGCTPATHGIDDFQTNTVQGSTFGRDPEEFGMRRVPPEELDETRIYRSDDVKVPWVWTLMDNNRAMQFGVFSPATYPAPELPEDGVWVSGYWNDPQLLRDNEEASNNEEVREKLVDEYENYPLTPYLAIPPAYPEDVETELEYLERKLEVDIEMSEQIHKARLEILKDKDWDIFLSEEFFCDNIQHLLWPRNPENSLHNSTDEKLREKDLLGKFYQHVDKILGKYLEEIPDNANIIVISAHGQEESNTKEGMYNQFDKLFKYGIWNGPEGWKYEDEEPDYSPPSRAEHNKNGMYIVSGPDFAENGESKPISCMDFTPLMLELYEYEKPEHLDGKTPKHLLN